MYTTWALLNKCWYMIIMTSAFCPLSTSSGDLRSSHPMKLRLENWKWNRQGLRNCWTNLCIFFSKQKMRPLFLITSGCCSTYSSVALFIFLWKWTFCLKGSLAQFCVVSWVLQLMTTNYLAIVSGSQSLLIAGSILSHIPFRTMTDLPFYGHPTV